MVRWLIGRDMAGVMEIEKEGLGWSEEDFLNCLRQRNCIGMVLEMGENVVGHMVYELGSEGLVILNLAIHPMYRMLGFGGQLMQRLKDKIEQSKRKWIEVKVEDSGEEIFKLFLRKMGFKVVRVLRGEGKYLFRWEKSRYEG